MATYNNWCGLLACLLIGFSGTCLDAQLDLLTVREAESLVEQVPEVRAAKRDGRCPDFTVSYSGNATFLVQARGACPDPDTVSTLISNYIVNRRTGVVTEGENPTSLTTSDMDSLRVEFLRRARNRSLLLAEASCLAMAAFKSEIELHEPSESFSIQSVGRLQQREMLFAVAHSLPSSHAIISEFLTVDPTSGRVRNDNTGLDVVSPQASSLLAKLVDVRFPPLLSIDAAVQVAMQVPAIAKRVANDCSTMLANGSGTAEEVFIGVTTRCPGIPETPGVLASVNIRSGNVSDPKTLMSLDTPQSRRAARGLLEEGDARQAKALSDIRRECSAK